MHFHLHCGSRTRRFIAANEHDSEPAASNSYLYTSLPGLSSHWIQRRFSSKFGVHSESYLSYWITNIQGSYCVISLLREFRLSSNCSTNKSFNIVTMLRHRRPGLWVLLPETVEISRSLSQCLDPLWAHIPSHPVGDRGLFPWGKAKSVKITAHSHLLPMSRKRGIIPPLPFNILGVMLYYKEHFNSGQLFFWVLLFVLIINVVP
jgi:hypothetical protein